MKGRGFLNCYKTKPQILVVSNLYFYVTGQQETVIAFIANDLTILMLSEDSRMRYESLFVLL